MARHDTAWNFAPLARVVNIACVLHDVTCQSITQSTDVHKPQKLQKHATSAASSDRERAVEEGGSTCSLWLLRHTHLQAPPRLLAQAQMPAPAAAARCAPLWLTRPASRHYKQRARSGMLSPSHGCWQATIKPWCASVGSARARCTWHLMPQANSNECRTTQLSLNLTFNEQPALF